MLNRRHLRVKVLQSLYAFIQSGNDDLAVGEKEMLFGIEKIYDLYLYQFSLLGELRNQALRAMDENRSKRLPSPHDLNPNTRFVDNQCLRMIADSGSLENLCSKRKIIWNNDLDLVRKLLAHIQQQKYYQKYMEMPVSSLDDDVEFVVKLIKKDLLHFELLHHFYEEKSIYWLDDWELVNKMLIKTLKNITEKDTAGIELLDLFKENEDREFARDLFKRTLLNQEDLDKIIAAKTQNWDIDRIALMDIIIMKMAITEILKFPQVPVKVSLNEYIELSKMYSTPKSKVFINGILDKLVEEFVSENKINKIVKGISPDS
jgi:transcription antitermination protein NusB